MKKRNYKENPKRLCTKMVFLNSILYKNISFNPVGGSVTMLYIVSTSRKLLRCTTQKQTHTDTKYTHTVISSCNLDGFNNEHVIEHGGCPLMSNAVIFKNRIPEYLLMTPTQTPRCQQFLPFSSTSHALPH